MVSMAVFMAAFVSSDAVAQSSISDIDNQIWNARQRIENLRKTRDKNVARDLNKNRDYRSVVECSAAINARRAQNERYLDQACQYLRRECHILLVVRTPFLFTEYSSKYGYIRTLRDMYEFNQREIRLYEQHLNRLGDFPLRVKNHHDSIMHAEIDKCQLMIDSLLNKKIQLTR